MALLTRRSLLAGGLRLLGSGATVACSPRAETSAPSGSAGASSPGAVITHVHAITRNSAAGVVLLATHEGLCRLQDQELTQAGPVVDLLGSIPLAPQQQLGCLVAGRPAAVGAG